MYMMYTYYTRAKLMSRCRLVTSYKVLDKVKSVASRAHHKWLDRDPERSIHTHLNRMLPEPLPILPHPLKPTQTSKKRECPAPANDNENIVVQTVMKPCACTCLHHKTNVARFVGKHPRSFWCWRKTWLV